MEGVLHVNRPFTFQGIVGHDDIKLIFQKSIRSKKPVHILLAGSPGSAKTMFLTEIMRHEKPSYFIVGSNTTKPVWLMSYSKGDPSFY